jgi:hypothetical protein
MVKKEREKEPNNSCPTLPSSESMSVAMTALRLFARSSSTRLDNTGITLDTRVLTMSRSR